LQLQVEGMLSMLAAHSPYFNTQQSKRQLWVPAAAAGVDAGRCRPISRLWRLPWVVDRLT
jgi:hypothetical protein